MNAYFQPNPPWISEEDYLQGELLGETKHEYIDGQVYALAGASKNHERIAGNVYREIGNHLKGKPCEPFASDIKVKVGTRFFYPDVRVVCDDPGQQEYYPQSPVLIVEIEQDIVDVEVCRRDEGWVSNHYFMGDVAPFQSIGLTLPVEEIYARVVNEDVRLFLVEDRPGV